MLTIIINYWMEILLTLTSIIVGFLVGYAFYRLQKRDVVSARVERVKRAKEELLDIIESHIINKQQFAEELIHNLIVASEREHEVNLNDFCTPTTLLQDVALRLQKSRHLDITRKSEYSVQIEDTIIAIKEHHKKVPEEAKESLDLICVLEDAIQKDDKQKGLETILLLRKKLDEAPLIVSTEYIGSLDRIQQITSIITGITAVVVTYTISTTFFDKGLGIDQIDIMKIFGLIFVMIIVLTFLHTRINEWIEK